MTTIEIKNKLSKAKIKMVVYVLKALGITAVFNEHDHDETKMSKKEFIEKIEKSRSSSKKKVSVSDQTKILGL